MEKVPDFRAAAVAVGQQSRRVGAIKQGREPILLLLNLGTTTTPALYVVGNSVFSKLMTVLLFS
jgi:hypothetical protein